MQTAAGKVLLVEEYAGASVEDISTEVQLALQQARERQQDSQLVFRLLVKLTHLLGGRFREMQEAGVSWNCTPAAKLLLDHQVSHASGC
jgi:hypothetical protein